MCEIRLPADTKCKPTPVLTLRLSCLLTEPEAPGDTLTFLKRKHTKGLTWKMQFIVEIRKWSTRWLGPFPSLVVSYEDCTTYLFGNICCTWKGMVDSKDSLKGQIKKINTVSFFLTVVQINPSRLFWCKLCRFGYISHRNVCLLSNIMKLDDIWKTQEQCNFSRNSDKFTQDNPQPLM